MWKYVTDDAMLSNLGQITIGSHYGQLRLEALWGPVLR